MATKGKAVIDVAIIGDAKGLQGAVKDADKSIGGLGKSAKGAALGLGALGLATGGVEFLKGALDNADRLDDAITVLEGNLGKVDAKPLEDMAGSMAKIGLSTPTFLELAGGLSNFGASVGIADDQLAKLTPNVIDAAVAFSATDAEGRSASDAMDLIEKAAGGSSKAAKALGVSLLEGVDPATQLTNITDQLHAKLGTAASQTDDLKGKQGKLAAEMDNLSTSVGKAVEGPLTDLLTFINDEIEAIPGAIAGFEKLGQVIYDGFATALSPVARVNDALGELGRTLRGIPFLGDIIGGIFGGNLSQSNVQAANNAFLERNGQGSP